MVFGLIIVLGKGPDLSIYLSINPGKIFLSYAHGLIVFMLFRNSLPHDHFFDFRDLFAINVPISIQSSLEKNCIRTSWRSMFPNYYLEEKHATAEHGQIDI